MTEHENTNETSQLRQTAVKCRFFAQYLGQKVFHGFSDCEMILQPHHLETSFYDKSKEELSDFTNPNPFLALKPLSQISDEDAIEFFDIVWSKVGNHKNKPKDFKIDFGKDWAMSPTSERYGLVPKGLFHGVDWLRSQGYALPFMEYSVDDLVSFGWVRLS